MIPGRRLVSVMHDGALSRSRLARVTARAGRRIVLAGVVMGLCLGSAALSTSERPVLKPGPTDPATHSNRVRFTSGYLTIQVEDVPLDELLDDIARQSGLVVKRYVALDQRVSDRFEQLPLDRALRRILRNRSFVLEYAAQRPTTLWIVPEGGERATSERTTEQPVSGDIDRPGSTARDGAEGRGMPDSDRFPDREEAALALGESTTDDAVTQLSLALIDDDPDVRSAAVSSLTEIGSGEAVQALAAALSDPDPRIREEAVDGLGEIGGEAAIMLLQLALADEEPTVRETAREALEQVREQIP